MSVLDLEIWTYTTVVAEVVTQFEAVIADPESVALEWVPVDEVRVVVNGALVDGTSVAVRAASAAVRGVQSGYLRYYAALLLVGLTGLGAYFLISA